MDLNHLEIYLIRHTKTATEQGLCYGQSDVPLAESFAEELCLLRGKLPEISHTCRVISSPLSRCLQLARTLGCEVETDSRLKELHFGDWENHRFVDLDQEAVKRWAEDFVRIAPPNGENFKQLCQRADAFWQDLVQSQASGQVIIVTHAGVIRALLAGVLHMPLEQAFRLRVDNASVHCLHHNDGYTTIQYINR